VTDGLRLATLHGFRDEPTDGVEDYATCLGRALGPEGVAARVIRLPLKEKWFGPDWPLAALNAVEGVDWVLIQYTAFQWSRRGLPFSLPALIRETRRLGPRVGVVFHDNDGMRGPGWLRTLRFRLERRIMRRLALDTDLAICTVNLEHAPWSEGLEARLRHLPVGANIAPAAPSARRENEPLTLSVFCITVGGRGDAELERLDAAVRGAVRGAGRPVRLVVFGRDTEKRRGALERLGRAHGVDVQVHGLVPEAKASSLLSLADVHLFLRGSAMTNRGSLLAGLAAGLPVLCVSELVLGPPLSEAGVVVVRPDEPSLLEERMAALASDTAWRRQLSSRTVAAFDRHFSWPVLARRLAGWLREPAPAR
jgi:hypothetical protein